MKNNWKKVKLGEVAEINKRRSDLSKYKDDIQVTFLPMKAVGDISGRIETPEVRKLSEVTKGYTYFEDGWVLFAKITPSMENGKATIAKDLVNGIGFGSTEFHTITPSDKILADYIFHFIRQQHFRIEAKRSFRGTAGQLRVPPEFLENYQIPLPPVSEQKEIVAWIQENLSILESNVFTIKICKEKIILYRKSLLESAFSGKLNKESINDEDETNLENYINLLTEDRKVLWAKFKNNQKYRIPVNSNTHTNLPKGWKSVSLESLGLVETGATPRRGNKEYWNGSIPWITSTVVNSNYVDKAEEFITEKALRETNVKIFPKGTIVIAMYGEGKTRGKFSELTIDASTNQALAALILSDKASEIKDFVRLFLYFNYENIRLQSSGGVQPNLNLEKIKTISLPLPPRRQRNEIVNILKSQLTVIDNMLKEIDDNLRKYELFKQSLLKKAFSGALIN